MPHPLFGLYGPAPAAPPPPPPPPPPLVGVGKTPHAAFVSAATEAPEFFDAILDPGLLAEIFNEITSELVEEIVQADPELLTQLFTLPESVVVVTGRDYIDLTDDGTGSGARQWLHITYMDANDGADEVWLSTIEARHRAPHDYDGFVVAHLYDQQTKLRKLAGWDGVTSLRIWGVPRPAEVDTQEFVAQELRFYYPPAFWTAHRLAMRIALAPHAGIKDNRLFLWTDRLGKAMSRVTMPLSSAQIEEGMIPRFEV